MRNLPFFIRLDYLLNKLKFGNINFTAKIDDGKIAYVQFWGEERRFFNRSELDTNGNEEGVKYLVNKIVEFLEKNQGEKITIEIFAHKQKIRKVNILTETKIIVDKNDLK
jgi:hypothetical protein